MSKTKVTASFSGTNHITTKIVIQHSPIQQVPDSKYVGYSITYQDYKKKVESKISLFQLLCGCIVKHLKRKTRKQTQLNYYNLVAIHQLLYGSETWIKKAKDISRIQGVEMRFLRHVKDYTRRDLIRSCLLYTSRCV